MRAANGGARSEEPACSVGGTRETGTRESEYLGNGNDRRRSWQAATPPRVMKNLIQRGFAHNQKSDVTEQAELCR